MIPGQSHRKLDLGEPAPVQESKKYEFKLKPGEKIYLLQPLNGYPHHNMHFINKRHAQEYAARSTCPVCVIEKHLKERK